MIIISIVLGITVVILKYLADVFIFLAGRKMNKENSKINRTDAFQMQGFFNIFFSTYFLFITFIENYAFQELIVIIIWISSYINILFYIAIGLPNKEEKGNLLIISAEITSLILILAITISIFEDLIHPLIVFVFIKGFFLFLIIPWILVLQFSVQSKERNLILNSILNITILIICELTFSFFEV